MGFQLPTADPSTLGLDKGRLEKLCARIERDIAAGMHPGAQVAVARHGKLALFRTFGDARTAPRRMPAEDRTLWLLYSNTKVITAAALWHLVEEGAIRFSDTVAQHVPGFEQHGKGEITLIQLLTHQAGFPAAMVPPEAWTDHELLRRIVCDFKLEWEPGSRVHYHTLAAHWTAGVLIEAVTGQDFRAFIREKIIAPLDLSEEIAIGLAPAQQDRAVVMHEPDAAGRLKPRSPEDSAAFQAGGVPGGGGFATARAMAAFYQMLAQGGALAGKRLFATRTIEYVTRNYTGDRIDGYMNLPMHRGLGPHSRGETPVARGLGALAHPRTFGHGGVGSSYCWADPVSGVSFAFLSNARQTEVFHNTRMDVLSNFVHTAIVG